MFRLFCRPANAILDETLSEQSYTRYLEGKLRETFGFRCSAEAECFSEFTLIWSEMFVLAGGLVPL